MRIIKTNLKIFNKKYLNTLNTPSRASPLRGEGDQYLFALKHLKKLRIPTSTCLPPSKRVYNAGANNKQGNTKM